MVCVSLILLQRTADYTVTQGYSSSMQLLTQIVFYIIAFIIVAILAFYSTKLIASAKVLKQSGCNVRIVERLPVNQHCTVLLIKTGGKYVLIGATKEHVSFLTEVDKEDIDTCKDDANDNAVPFKNVFNQILNHNKGRKDEE